MESSALRPSSTQLNTQTNKQKPMTNRMKNGMRNTGKYLYDKGKIPFNMSRRYLILNLIDRHKLMELLGKALLHKNINKDVLENITLFDILKKKKNSNQPDYEYIKNIVRRHNDIELVEMRGGKKPVKKAPTKKPVKKAPAKKPVKKAPTKKPVKKATTKKPVKKATTKKPVKKAIKKSTKKGGDIPCNDWKAQGFNSKAECIESQR